MKKIYYVRTNGYDMLVTYDAEAKIVRFLNGIDVRPFLGNLNLVDDDSSWENEKDVDNVEEWLGIGKGYVEEPEILETIVFKQEI